MKFSLLATFGLLAVLLSACSTTEKPQGAEALTDEGLRELVVARLQSDSNTRRLNLEVAANSAQRAVELQGVAYTQRQRTRAVELARSAGPDIAVQDKIQVNPYDIPRDLFDDDMMTDVRADADAMGDKIGDSMDDGWLHMKVVAKLVADSLTPQRTINVDVADSVVTLRGTVPSPEGRLQAETLAKSVSGVTSVNNRLTVKR